MPSVFLQLRTDVVPKTAGEYLLNADKSWISTPTWTLQWNPGCLGVSCADLRPFEASLRPREPYIEIQRWEAVGEAGSTSLKNPFQGQVWLCATTWTPSSRTEEWGNSAPPSTALLLRQTLTRPSCSLKIGLYLDNSATAANCGGLDHRDLDLRNAVMCGVWPLVVNLTFFCCSTFAVSSWFYGFVLRGQSGIDVGIIKEVTVLQKTSVHCALERRVLATRAPYFIASFPVSCARYIFAPSILR